MPYNWPPMVDPIRFRGRRLCVVGNLNRDLRTAPLAPGRHLFGDGETSVPFIAETVGGGGANSALFAAALGATVRLVAKVGDDALGTALERQVRRRGVKTFLARDPKNPTGSSINLVYGTGRRHFVSCLPSSAITFAEINPAALRGVEHVLRADVWFSEPMLFGGNEKLLAAAKAAGAHTSVDINWDPAWGKAPAGKVRERKRAVRSVLPLVDVVHGNVRELCEFSDAPTLTESLRRLHRWGAGAVVVHMGAKGAGYSTGRGQLRCPCVPAPRIVNATGTGDLLSVIMMLLHRDEGDVGEKLGLANRLVSRYVAGEGLFAG